MARRWGFVLLCFGAVLLSCGDDDDSGAGGQDKRSDGGQRDDSGSGASGSGKQAADGPPCLIANVSAEISATKIDKVDMLFVVGNSNTMHEEQAALRAQFAHLIQALATGDVDGDGQNEFAPVKDLHLGVVSSDMGLSGIEGIDHCSGLGDDGILKHAPSAEVQGCQPSYPTFLSFTAGVTDPKATANDFACIGTLGTSGCGFEQPLESALKALWPSVDPMSRPDGQNRITFLGTPDGQGILGHGDTDNQGFLHNDPTQGLSVIAVVVVTDEEDCSSSSTKHFTPPQFLDPNDPLAQQPLNLRCFFNQHNSNGDELFALHRYVNGFKALRPGNENLVVFGAIAGVPADLVDAQHRSMIDFTDPASLDNYYAKILGDPRMQEQIDPASMDTPGSGNLVPSCQTKNGVAFPPRRIVEVAHELGQNAMIQSICQEDFGPALDAIVSVIGKQLGAPCLPRSLSRSADNLVPCHVIWELPAPNQAPPGTPTTCADSHWDFLRAPSDGPKISDRGSARCEVAQLAVKADDSGVLKPVPTETRGERFSEGWYYDDFSASVRNECKGPTKQRIAFSSGIEVPTGVVVKLECQDITVTTDLRTDLLTDIEQPQVGDACDYALLNQMMLSGDDACAVRLAKPTKTWPDSIDRSMFCHPETNTCVLSCDSDADCPDDWSCDDSAATRRDTGGRAFCKAPSCSAGSAAASTKHVGDLCLPYSIPAAGYDDHEVYVGTANADCDGGVCLVYHLQGDPLATCTIAAAGGAKLCASPADTKARAFCSCRCNSPDGFAACDCPSGFACVDVLEQGDPEVRGGYCVREGL